MPNTFIPTQIGYIPTGAAGIVQVSSVTIGRTITGLFEGAGFGANGRPDPATVVQINLANLSNGIWDQYGSITLNATDVLNARSANTHLPVNLNLTLKEISICDNGTAKRAMVIMSQTYAVP